MHEIVTVQVGRRANYLCTHYWNTQESYQTFAPAPPSPIDHDVHFRQGIASDGSETYLPRTLIYDLKPGFGSLARTNVLGNLDTDENLANTLWNGSLTHLPPIPQSEPSEYTMSLLDSKEPVLPTTSTTSFFADFASNYYHPRSMIPITPPFPTSSQSVSAELTAFATSGTAQSSNFEAGRDMFMARDADVDILDADIRLWLEECDSLQAVQVFTSSDDAWAGFAAKYVERLRDELGKGCIWVWGIDFATVAHEPGNKNQNQSHKREIAINAAMAVHTLAEQASMFVPLSIPNQLPNDITLDLRSLWHTSAFLEAAVESSTLATRLREKDLTGSTLRDWQDVLSDGGRRTIAQLGFDTDFDAESDSVDPRMRQVIADVDEEAGHLVQPKIMLATDASNTGSTQARHKAQRNKIFSRIESFRGSQKILDKILLDYKPPVRGNPVETFCVPLSFSLLPTYPKIFTTTTRSSSKSVRIHSTLDTSSDVARWVRSLQSSIRLGIGPMIAGEEREAVYSNLGDIAEKYIEDWESADESEDDDS